MNINIIKDKVKFFFKSIDKLNLVKNSHEIIRNDENNNEMTSILTPVFYLFNNDLIKNIYLDSDIFKYIRTILNLDELMCLHDKNILYINDNNNTSLLYHFNFSNNYYIYYSNQSFSINQLINTKNQTVCKILTTKDNILLKNIFITINFIINECKNLEINSWVLLKKKLDDDLNFKRKINIIFDDRILESIIDGINEIDNDKKCYILLNLICSIHNDKIFECSINHIVGENDNIFQSEIKQLLFNNKCEYIRFDTSKNYVMNFKYNNIYKNIYKNIYTIPKSKYKNKFELFVDELIKQLKLIEEPSLKYKILESLKFEYHNINGLYFTIFDNKGVTFNNYYVLGLNMLIIEKYINNKSINEIIENIIEFHYKILYLFCMSHDTKLTPVENNYYGKFNNYNNTYIYKLINKNNMLNELIEFYQEDTFILNKDKLSIDKLLNYKIEGKFLCQENIFNSFKCDKNIFYDLFKYLDDIIYNISKKNTIDKTLMTEQIKYIFENIISDISTSNNLLKKHTDYINFFKTIAEIFICYLLIHIDNHSISKTSDYINNEEYSNFNYYFLYINNPNYIYNFDENSYLYNFLLLRLNNSEVKNISKYITGPHISKIISDYNLIYFKNVIISDSEHTRNGFHPVLNINLHLRFNPKDFLYLERVYIYYHNNSINEKIDYNIKLDYKKEISFIKNTVKSIINLNYIEYISISVLILTNNKLLLINNDETFKNKLKYYMCINKDTQIIETNNIQNNISSIIYLCKNESNEDLLVDKLIELLGVNFTDINQKLINNFNFTIDYKSPTIYIKDGIEFLSLKYDKNNNNNRIDLILLRFGFLFEDLYEYIFLYEKSGLDRSFNIIKRKSKCLIYIKKYDKIIEININDDSYIDESNCYIIDKNGRYNLLLNLNINKHPFILLFPHNSPYICYQNKNNYYVDFIISSNYNRCYFDNVLLFDEIRKDELEKLVDKVRIDNLEDESEKYSKDDIIRSYFDIYSFKIAPSLLFPSINNYDYTQYKFLFKIYDSKPYNLNRLNEIKSFNIELLSDLSNIINSLEIELCKSISCSIINLDKFKKSLESELCENESRELVYNNFYNENRICNIYNYTRSYDNIIMILNCMINSIILNLHVDNIIIDNLDKIILFMEINILINLIKDINSKSSCWDIQYILIQLKSIKYFNEKIASEFFYTFELLFLFQCEYFYKQNQMEKYKEIISDIHLKNPRLKLHQFMMGKGKTSVFSPLISFYINYVNKKQSTIITMNHLVKPTKNYTRLLEFITNIDINIFSDSKAKERWINNKDLNNEINIIDEFDSHHNYLQSMFNSIKSTENIKEELFNYIYIFTFKKIKDPKYKGDKDYIEGINKNILNENLNDSFKIMKTMKYNELYGFFNLKNDYNRVCIPYIRKDTPVKGSNFSSILLTLMLTFNVYITKYNCSLNEELYDFDNLINQPSLINKLYSKFLNDERRSEEIQKIIKLQDVNILIKIFSDEYPNMTIETKNEILSLYLYDTNKDKLKITTSQDNISFQDIIYNNYDQFQVGYTGTTSLNLNNYDKDDKFVFRDKIEDFDEKIEVKLALEGYGYDDYNKSIGFININDSININIGKIVLFIKDNPRGFIDLCGLFIDQTNKEIASMIQKILPDKKIIYFSDDDAYELSTNMKYVDNDPMNFYYYDQCHTIGSDLKHARDGHITILIDKNTRWTLFAQAIFRFRKLNRGTYLSVLFVHDNELHEMKNNDDIYKLLNDNEIEFNKQQINGLSYQLLKTMVRKKSKNYLEDNLKPEFMLNDKLNKQSIIEIMNNNIKDLNIKDKNIFINDLYEKIISIKPDNLLINLVTGSNNLIEYQAQLEQESLQANEIQKTTELQQDKEYNVDMKKQFLKRLQVKMNVTITLNVNEFTYITHLNCDYCDAYNCLKFFKDDNIKINNKPIYLSYNFLKQDLMHDRKDSSSYERNAKYDILYPQDTSYNLRILSNRFYYIEFNNKILIEIENVALDYYLYKLPVYNYVGELVISYLGNDNNIKNKDKLDIDINFMKLFRIKNYTNPNKINEIIIPIQKVIENINDEILKLLHWIFINDRSGNLEIPEELLLHLEKLKMINSIINVNRNLKHNDVIKDNIENVYFNKYEQILKLNDDGYDLLDIPKFNQDIYYSESYNREYNINCPIIKLRCYKCNYNSSNKKYYKKYKLKNLTFLI